MKKGFTLIEVIIYTLLVAMILTTVVLATNTALQIRGKTNASLILEENMRFAITTIVERVRAANDVTAPLIGSPGNTLILASSEPTQNPTTITVTNGVIMMTEGTSAATAITGDNIEITNLVFTTLAGTPSPVQISMSGQTKNATGTYRATNAFSALAVPQY